MSVLRSFQKQMIGAGAMGVVALAAASYASAGSILLDGFGDLPTVAVGDTVGPYPVLDTDLSNSMATVSVSGSIDSGITPVPGAAALSTGATGDAMFVFSYTFDSVDLTLVNLLMIDIDAVGTSVVDLGFDIVLTDGGGLQGTFTDMFSGDNASLSFFLSAFTFAPGFDVTDVVGLDLTINTSAGDDFFIDTFKGVIVPTPTAAGFGLLGLSCLVFRRRG
ncbi:MAG: hypothetical protein AAGB29_13545 [Planctomycetota bacterium]